jgi:hypothetical protein
MKVGKLSTARLTLMSLNKVLEVSLSRWISPIAHREIVALQD